MASPAFAAKNSQQSEIDELRSEVQALKSEVQTLKGQQQTTQAQTTATQEKVDTAVAAVAKVTPPKGKKGIQIGAVTVTPGGFIEAAGVYRNKNQASDVGQNFNEALGHEPLGSLQTETVDPHRGRR